MKKFERIINFLILVGSIFIFVGYFCYLIKLFVWSEGLLPYIVATFICIFVPLMLVFHKKGILKKFFGKLYPAIKTVYAAGLIFYMLTFSYLCGYIFGLSLAETPASKLPKNTTFVILGAKVNANGEPGVILRRRIETAIGLLSSCPEAKCVVSGGKGKDEPISEAECMKNYLVSHGISPDRIMTEDKSHNTIENIKNVKEMLLDYTEDPPSLAFITTNYHIPRVRILCEKIGLDTETYFYSAPNSSPIMLYTNLVREYMSYCKLFLLGT